MRLGNYGGQKRSNRLFSIWCGWLVFILFNDKLFVFNGNVRVIGAHITITDGG